MEREYSQKYLQISRLKGIKVVFEATETPFFRVDENLCDLGENEGVAKDFDTRYPMIKYSKACLADGAIIIQDIDLLPNLENIPSEDINQTLRSLNEFSNITLQVVDGFSLTKSLIETMKRTGVFEESPIFIFPGEGARSVNEYIRRLYPELNYQGIFLPTKRTKTDSGKFKLEVDYSPLPQELKSGRIFIVDDVVASGQTASKVSRDIKSIFPDINCRLATWLLIKPSESSNKRSMSGVEGIDETYVTIALKGNYMGRPPINSVSCFLRSGEKYDQVKTAFIEKYIADSTGFEKAIRQLKGVLYE